MYFKVGDVVTEDGYDHKYQYVIEKFYAGKLDHFWLKRVAGGGPSEIERRWDEIRLVAPAEPDECEAFFV